MAKFSRTTSQIDAILDDVEAAKGESASLADAIESKIAEETAAREAADNAIQTDLETRLTAAQVYRGTKIEANTDLNDLTTYGTYYCDSSSVAATLSNCPVSGSGFVLQIYSTGNRIEYLYPVSASNSKFYWRCRTSNTWQQWFVVEGVPVA